MTGGRLLGLRLALIDLDGTLFRGDSVIEGAPEFVERIRRNGIQPVYFTNNSTRTPEHVADKLNGLGIRADATEVCTTAMASASYIRNRLPHESNVLYIGAVGLKEALLSEGLRPTHVSESDSRGDRLNFDAAVAGMDSTTTYEQLAIFCHQVMKLGAFTLTNADKRLPTATGYQPGTGAIGHFIETATGVVPTVIGKPSSEFVEYALRRYGVAKEEACIIGDNLMTDIAAGNNAGVHSIFVRTGVDSDTSLPTSSIQPDEVFESVANLFQ